MNILGCGWSFRKFHSELMKHDRNSWTDLGPMSLYFPTGRWRPNGLASIFFSAGLVWKKPGKRWVRGLMPAMVGCSCFVWAWKMVKVDAATFTRGILFAEFSVSTNTLKWCNDYQHVRNDLILQSTPPGKQVFAGVSLDIGGSGSGVRGAVRSYWLPFLRRPCGCHSICPDVVDSIILSLNNSQRIGSQPPIFKNGGSFRMKLSP